MSERIESIFHVARELSGVEREGYLRGACGKDLAMRTKVEALLKADDEAEAFLKSASFDKDATVDESAGSSASVEQPGNELGRYKLLQNIGEGGFGSVWMAEQRVPVKRRVALKIIKLGMDTKQVIARFEAERQALAMMDHPNIAKVLDAGSTDIGRPYFVMEYIRGVPILEYCDTEKLDPDQRLKLFIPVCQAIQHAHQKGIIHRDLKPSNVLVTLHDGKPVPKVIDFGIAKATSAELTNKTLFTQHRQMIGTPAYMSPEQAEMSGLDIDTRSDIYSLGVLLYELLTGTTPFEGKSLMAAGYDKMMKIIREEEPLKPSDRLATLGETLATTASQRHTDAGELKSLLTGDMDWIVMKCLEKDRTRRYETANGLAADIQRHLDDEPVLAGPPSKRYKLKKFVKRNKAQVVAFSVVAIVLVLGVIGTSVGMAWAVREANRADREATKATQLAQSEAEAKEAAVKNEKAAREQKELAERELARATEIKTLITGMLAGVDPETAQGADTTLLKGILNDAAQRLNKGEIKDPLIAAELHEVIGRVYVKLGLYKEAVQHLPRAMQTYQEKLGEEDRRTLALMTKVSELYRIMGYNSIVSRVDEALPLAEKAFKTSTRVLGPEDRDTLAAMREVAMVYFSLPNRTAEVEPLLIKGLESAQRRFGPEDRRTVLAMRDLALFYTRMGRFEEAKPLYETVYETTKRTEGKDSPRTVVATCELAFLYQNNLSSDAGKAEPLYLTAIEDARRVLGPAHPRTLNTMRDLAQLYALRGRSKQADQLYQAIIDTCRANADPENGNALAAGYILAVRQNRIDDALSSLEKYSLARPSHGATTLTLMYLQAWLGRDKEFQATARRVLDAVEGTDDPPLADMTAKACSSLPLDDPELRVKALKLAQVAVERGKGSQYMGYYLLARGMAEYRSGDYSAAEQTLSEAERQINESDDTVKVRLYLAMSLYQLGKHEQARAAFDRGMKSMPPLPEDNKQLGEYAFIGNSLGHWVAYKQASALTGFKNTRVEGEGPVNKLWQQADQCRREGKNQEAIELRKEVLQLCIELYGQEHDRTFEAMKGLSRECRIGGQDIEALALREQVLDRSRKLADVAPKDQVNYRFLLLWSYRAAGRHDEMLKLSEETLKLSRKLIGNESTFTLDAMNWLAEAYAQAERFDEAMKLRKELSTLATEVFGADHVFTKGHERHTLGLAKVIELNKRYQDQLKQKGPEDPATLQTRSDLTNAYHSAGCIGKAIELNEQLARLYTKLFGPEDHRTISASNVLGWRYHIIGRRKAALDLREKQLTLCRKVFGPEHATTINATRDLAISYDTAGRLDEAIKLNEEAVRLYTKVSGPNNKDTLGTMLSLAGQYDKVGRKDEAKALREQVEAIKAK